MNYDKKIVLRNEYISRINRVQDYIENNLSEEFSLNQLSQIANFSPYHFHRIFYIMRGETLFQYIQRVRLEKAAFFLLANRKTAITEIALECGFSNQASFAKAFKKHFGVSASGFRIQNSIKKSKNYKGKSNMGKVFNEIIHYNSSMKNKQCSIEDTEADIPFTVEVKSVENMNVVYIRNTGPYKKDAALFEMLFKKLYHWGDLRDMVNTDETKWLTLFHDQLDLTDDDKIRISLCMTVHGNVEVDGEIGKMTILGGKYAVGRFELMEDQYQNAWNVLCGKWLPESGYQPDDRLCFEMYSNNASNTSGERQIVDIYIPIKPL